MIESLNCTVTGARHLESGRIGQDASSCCSEEGYTIAAVSDGHGAPLYFRSDAGARFAVDAAVRQIGKFLTDDASRSFSSADFFAMRPCETIGDANAFLMTRFISSFIGVWRLLVELDYRNMPARNDEIERVINCTPDNHEALDLIRRCQEAKGDYFDGLYEIYGCTVAAVAVTQDFWFAFQIGDGKCLALQKDGSVIEPLPSDPLCHGNITTSLSDETPIDYVRFCYGGKDTIPAAILLCTDGLVNSYDNEGLRTFFKEFVEEWNISGKTKVEKTLRTLLPRLSAERNPHGDDISAAFIKI